VTDQAFDCLPVVHRGPPRDLGGGYGLHIVATLAQAWGYDATDRHKTVWAEIDLAAIGP